MSYLRSLRLIHWAKAGKEAELSSVPPGAFLRRALFGVNGLESSLFHIATCQRELWIFDEEALAEVMGSPVGPERICAEALRDGAEVYSGAGAYGFLLRFSTGLESAVRGETDVFGQLRDAWSLFEQGGSRQARELSSWIQRLYEDTKEIRSRFLQSVGGASYGSLVRQILRKQSLQIENDIRPILLIGAGPIAVSVAPWLATGEFGPLWVANRTASRAESLAQEVVARQGEKARPALVGWELESELKSWQAARAVVIGVPLDAARDELRRAHCPESTPIVHLGTLRAEAPAWRELPNFFALDDLFEIQRQAEGVRGDRFTRALQACEERARLRAMGGSLSISHGWEDLAAFI